MIKENQVFIENLKGTKVEDFFSIIEEFTKLNYKIFIHYKYNIKKYENDIDLSNVFQIKKRGSVEYLASLYSSKYIIVDHRFWTNYEFKKTPGQILVQLWHGVPFKHLGYDNLNINSEGGLEKINKTFDHEMSQTDYLLVPNSFCEKAFESAWKLSRYDVKLISSGYPRNDWILDKKFKKCEIPGAKGKEIVLVVPTWEENAGWGQYQFPYNINEIVEKLADTHYFIFSFHYFASMPINLSPKTNNWSVNNNWEIDNQNLFNLADCLITDFSSIMFDFALTNKKIINMFSDEVYNKYISTRGAYFDMHDFNFNIAKTETELINKIIESDFHYSDQFKKLIPLKTSGVAAIIETLNPKNFDKEEVFILNGNQNSLENDILTIKSFLISNKANKSKLNYLNKDINELNISNDKLFLNDDSIRGREIQNNVLFLKNINFINDVEKPILAKQDKMIFDAYTNGIFFIPSEIFDDVCPYDYTHSNVYNKYYSLLKQNIEFYFLNAEFDLKLYHSKRILDDLIEQSNNIIDDEHEINSDDLQQLVNDFRWTFKRTIINLKKKILK